MVPLADFSREMVNLEVKYVGRVGRPFARLKQGGMGFTDIETLNLSLLAK